MLKMPVCTQRSVCLGEWFSNNKASLNRKDQRIIQHCHPQGGNSGHILWRGTRLSHGCEIVLGNPCPIWDKFVPVLLLSGSLVNDMPIPYLGNWMRWGFRINPATRPRKSLRKGKIILSPVIAQFLINHWSSKVTCHLWNSACFQERLGSRTNQE